jgi:hypothetical protein
MLLVLMLILAACGGEDDETPTSTSSAGASDTQVAGAVAATLTAQPVATLAPTVLPATKTPAPTSTPQPTPAPSPTVEPTATPTLQPTPAPTATATAPPAPTSTSTVVPAPTPPPLGESVDLPPLSEWDPIDEERYEGFVGEDGAYHLRITEPCSGVLVCGITDEPLADAGRVDLSVQVDMRLVAAETPSSSACVALGYEDADGHFAEFWLCLMADGKTFAVYADGNLAEGFDRSPTFLLAPAVRAGANSATDWNQLQIIIDGDHVWFLANQEVLLHEPIVASASEIPTIGIHIGNAGDPPVEFQFDRLLVHHVN